MLTENFHIQLNITLTLTFSPSILIGTIYLINPSFFRSLYHRDVVFLVVFHLRFTKFIDINLFIMSPFVIAFLRKKSLILKK